MAQEGSFYAYAIDGSALLSGIYEKADLQKALAYNRMAIMYKDSLYNQGREIALENLSALDEQERQYEIETARTTYRNQVKQYILISGLLVFLLIAFLLYRNNLHRKKAYARLQKQKQETEIQKVKAEETLTELKATQVQLIQSEVSNELIDEMKSEMATGNLQQATQIADDVKQNLEKIIHHGKRADAIVKGMLQHSRTSSGQKELTDINALADEYLRLSYHGLRAKDKSFNATIKTDFDQSLEKINIIPQEIGRVILNLITNSFYTVTEKKKQAGDGYEPTVSVKTKKINGNVEIIVKDNGSGIPQKIRDKIFQPFFTTKPTGHGTGLGLSLAYDIVKAHGGEIKVETKEDEGAEFTIQLPV
jgi:signal transduction histidine kinase